MIKGTNKGHVFKENEIIIAPNTGAGDLMLIYHDGVWCEVCRAKVAAKYAKHVVKEITDERD